MIIVYTPCKNRTEAAKIAKYLLGKKLVACANILPTDSLYYWKGKLCSEKESILILKTQTKHFPKIKKEITKLHSYEIPAILKWNVSSSSAFGKWVKEKT